MKKGTKKRQLCMGGPLRKTNLMLSSEGTLVFTLNGKKGYYDRSMRWRKVK